MDITFIFKLIIMGVFTWLTVNVIPVLKSKVSADDWDTLYRWVVIAVRAAEMIYNESGMGTRKKEYVRDFLSSKGYTVDDEEIDTMIEAAVLDLKREVAP